MSLFGKWKRLGVYRYKECNNLGLISYILLISYESNGVKNQFSGFGSRREQNLGRCFFSSLWGDVAICTEASSGPNAQPHIP